MKNRNVLQNLPLSTPNIHLDIWPLLPMCSAQRADLNARRGKLNARPVPKKINLNDKIRHLQI